MNALYERITQWAADVRWEDLPDEVTQRAAWALNDTMSTMVGGSTTEAARIAARYASRQPGTGPLVRAGTTLAPAMSAFANGVAASALDFDDGHYLAGAIHPGSVVIPGALAMLDERTRLEDLLLAQVVGYEVGLRAAALLWPKSARAPYHTTGCAGAIGAAAAAGKLRGFTAEQFDRVIRLAWVHAPVSTFGTPMVKESIGWGASTGVAAVELVEEGFMSRPAGTVAVGDDELHPPTPFHKKEAADDPAIVAIGERFEVMNTYFKSFAACRYTHAAAAGFGELMARDGLTADDVAAVRVDTLRGALFLNDRRPQTIESAQYSFPFVLASLAVRGAAGAHEISGSPLDAPRILAFADKVTLEYDQALDVHYPQRYPASVHITGKDGEVRSGTFLDAPFDPGTPYGHAELREKWTTLLRPALGERTDTMLDAVETRTGPAMDALAPAWDAS